MTSTRRYPSKGEDSREERREIIFRKLFVYLEECDRVAEIRAKWSPEFRRQVEAYEASVRKQVQQANDSGIAYGRRQSMFQIVQARFGDVPPDLYMRINQADDATLRAMIDRALTVVSVNEL